MSRQPKRSSPPASRRPPTSNKPSLSLRLLASAIAISPFLFEHTATELLYPLFSSAPAHSLETTIPFYSLLVVAFISQRALLKVESSWRTHWLIIGVWKILSEGIVRYTGQKLLNLGLEKGVLAGRLLLEAIPLLATANWLWDQFSCKEVRYLCTDLLL